MDAEVRWGNSWLGSLQNVWDENDECWSNLYRSEKPQAGDELQSNSANGPRVCVWEGKYTKYGSQSPKSRHSEG